MSAAQPLPWQTALWSRLTGLADGGRLAHALLLAGPRGVGKGRFATAFASFLLCESAQKPCGECRGCIQVASGSHPNLLRLRPEEEKREIAIDDVRALIDRLHLSSHYGKPKVAIVEPADALNVNGVNALLKTVEEPPAATYLLFVAERWRALPPTLRSRCQILRFAAPPADAALAWLKAQHAGEDAKALAAWVRAPLLAAAALDTEAAAVRQKWTQALNELAEGRLQALKLAEKLKRDDAQAGLELWLQLAAAWLRARLAPGRGATPPGTVSVASLERLLGDIAEGLRGLNRNGNPAMILESIMIRFAQGA